MGSIQRFQGSRYSQKFLKKVLDKGCAKRFEIKVPPGGVIRRYQFHTKDSKVPYKGPNKKLHINFQGSKKVPLPHQSCRKKISHKGYHRDIPHPGLKVADDGSTEQGADKVSLAVRKIPHEGSKVPDPR